MGNLPYWSRNSWSRNSAPIESMKVMMRHAILNENIKVAEWVSELFTNNLFAENMDDYWMLRLMEYSFGIARNANQIDCVKFIVVDKWKYNTSFCRRAVHEGNLHLLKNLLDIGFWSPKNICMKAARNGHVDMLKYLHQRGHKLSRHAMDAAIRNNHVECIQYCTEQGIKPSPRGKL